MNQKSPKGVEKGQNMKIFQAESYCSFEQCFGSDRIFIRHKTHGSATLICLKIPFNVR